MDIKKIKEFLDSEEGKKSLTEFFQKFIGNEEIETRQLERLNARGNFEVFTDKVITKYSTLKYRDRWYNRGIEPPEELFWFLFNYAEKYGRECNKEEWSQYGNMFTSALFFCNGYYFNKMVGQGSVINIIKENSN